MRILHLWDNYTPGLFDHSLEICRKEGIEAALVCLTLIDRGDASVPADLQFVRSRNRPDDAHDLVARVQRKVRGWADARRFRGMVTKAITKFRPDALHIHFGTTAAILASSDKVMSLPFVVSFYGFDISQALTARRTRSSYRRIMRRNPLVNVLCAEAAERAISLGASQERIIDANLPLPVDRYHLVGLEQERISRWLIPARFVAKKGHEVLFQAFRQHLGGHPDHHLTCWGYGDAEWLQRRAIELGVASNVSVINNEDEGPFDEAYLAQLRKHDVILAPSIRSDRGDDEGGPALTAVLAQIAGKPVIVSDFPGSERSVTDGIEGLVVPQGDVPALRRAMEVLTDDPELARKMGEAGRTRAIREFNHSAYRDALIGSYRRLVT